MTANHNTYLGLFADTGFPAWLILFVTLYGCLLRECFRIRRSLDPGDHFERNLALSSIGLVTITLWEGMSGDLRFDPTLNALTFLFLGITASMKGRRRESGAVNTEGRRGQGRRKSKSE